MEFKKYNHSKEEKIITDYWIKNKLYLFDNNKIRLKT